MIMRETGFLQGLYSSEELNPDNIKDRDGKIAFLEKLIAAVKLSTGANISARPTKIVAGLEVEKTNELLQIIGRALEKKIDSSKAVEKLVKGSKKTSNSKTKDVPKSKATKEVIFEESKVKDKSDIKKKKPVTRSKENVVKESTSKSKHTNKKDNVTPPRSKEKSPTKSVSNDRATKVKHETSRDSDVRKNEQVGLDGDQIENEKEETVEPDQSPVVRETPALQKRPSVEKPGLYKKLSREKLVTNETSVDFSESNDVVDQKEDSMSPEKIEAVPVVERNEDVSNNEKLLENEDIDKKKREQSIQDKEKEVKEETVKIKRPSSAHHGHRRHSSARRISDVENGADPKLISQAVATAPIITDSVASNLASTSTNNSNVPEDVQILGVVNANSSEPAVKVSPPIVSRPRTAARPPSARPGAPRVRDRGHVEVVEDARSPSVSVNVIVDAESTKDEDDENLVVLEAQVASNEEQVEQPKPELNLDAATDLGLEGKEQGRLVAQILETQRELELSGGLSSKIEIEWEGGRKRERETALKEVDRLRGAIQSLTRAANPLGKLIDFLQEDVDSMQRELVQWQQMNSQLAKELQTEESLTESSLEPLQIQLEELDQLIQDELDKVSAVKASIIRNDERILKLLPGVHHS